MSRLPGYLTVQMVRFQFKQKDSEGINAKILKDIKFPKMLDTFDFCSEDLRQKLIPMRTQFKVGDDFILPSLLSSPYPLLNFLSRITRTTWSRATSGG